VPEVVPITEQAADPAPLTLAVWTAAVLNRWRIIVGTAVATLLIALLAAVILPPMYRVTVSFAPNPTSSSKLSGALSSGLGALSGLTGELGLGAATEPTESPAFYAELLQSRELVTRLLLTRFADPRTPQAGDSARLVDILKLRSTEPRRRIELGVKALTKSMRTESDPKTNLIKLTVENQYPELAAHEANAALAMVNKFNLEQRASRARGKRLYLQTRLAQAQDEMTRAQARHRDFLAGNRQWASSPTLSSDEETLRRQEEVATDLYLSIEKQVEAAQMDEFNDAALITVVDSAVAPARPYWPHYTLLVPGAILFGLFLGVMIAGIAAVYADWSAREPAAARQLAAALHLRARFRDPRESIARRA